MKRIRIFLLLMMSLSVITSCVDKGPDPDFRIEPGNVLVQPEDEYIVDLPFLQQNVKNAKVTFEWNESTAMDGGFVSYELLFDLEEGDFTSPIDIRASSLTGSGKNLSLNVKAMNEVALKSGVAAGETVRLKWTVRASKGIKGSIYSQQNTITVRTLPQ
ncbi:MAG: SusE domain-containing protein [Candidatus Cryptobacteroides sp.]